MGIYNQIRSNRLRSFLLVVFFIGLITFFFYLAGEYVGNATFYFALGFLLSVFFGLGSYFYSDKIVLAMTGAKPALRKEHFNFYTVAENLSIAAGLPMPKLYVIEDDAPNAFATGRNPERSVVVATTGLLKRLERVEIEGVVAHELSHIKNYDILLMSIVVVLVGMIVYASDWIGRSIWWQGDRRDSQSKRGNAIVYLLFLLFLILTPVAATLIQLAISRRREFLADASGVLLTRYPQGLVSALEKISADQQILKTASNATAHLFITNPFKKREGKTHWLATLFSTHPPVEERISLLREM